MRRLKTKGLVKYKVRIKYGNVEKGILYRKRVVNVLKGKIRICTMEENT